MFDYVDNVLILQNILFYAQYKKETHTGLERHEGE